MAAKLMKKLDRYLTLHKLHELAANGKKIYWSSLPQEVNKRYPQMAGKNLKKLKDHTTLDTELRIWHPFVFGEIRKKKGCMNPM